MARKLRVEYEGAIYHMMNREDQRVAWPALPFWETTILY